MARSVPDNLFASRTVSSPPRILGLGVVVVDHVLSLPRHPLPDSKNEATASRLHGGGPVPVALAQLKRFGWEAAFVSRWGEDPFGEFIEDWLRRDGIDFPGGCRQDRNTGVSHVWIEADTGIRTSVTVRPDSAGLEELVDERRLGAFDILHLDGWAFPAAHRAARIVKNMGGIICVDTGSPKPGIDELLRLADIVNAPLKFCRQFFGTTDGIEGSRRLAALGPKIVTVTNGDRGAVLRRGHDVWSGDPLPLKQVVDTNGAGDVFTAGLIHAATRGFPGDRLLQFAVAAAGLKCQAPTSDRLVPDENAVLNCLDQVRVQRH